MLPCHWQTWGSLTAHLPLAQRDTAPPPPGSGLLGAVALLTQSPSSLVGHLLAETTHHAPTTDRLGQKSINQETN